jgi:hypothetical protein
VVHEAAHRACYLAEIFLPRRDPERLEAEAQRIRAAAEALAESGVRVRYLHWLFVPREETAFHVFDTELPDAIEQVLRDAGLEAERISPAIAATGFTPDLQAVHALVEDER